MNPLEHRNCQRSATHHSALLSGPLPSAPMFSGPPLQEGWAEYLTDRAEGALGFGGRRAILV